MISNSISWSTCRNFWSHSSISVVFRRESDSSSADAGGSARWWLHHSMTLSNTASFTYGLLLARRECWLPRGRWTLSKGIASVSASGTSMMMCFSSIDRSATWRSMSFTSSAPRMRELCPMQIEGYLRTHFNHHVVIALQLDRRTRHCVAGWMTGCECGGFSSAVPVSLGDQRGRKISLVWRGSVEELRRVRRGWLWAKWRVFVSLIGDAPVRSEFNQTNNKVMNGV